LRSIKLLDLLLKHSSNTAGGVACLELVSERVVKKVLLCSSLVFFQGIIENLEEFGGRCGRRVRLRHDCGRKEWDQWVEGMRTEETSTTPQTCSSRMWRYALRLDTQYNVGDSGGGANSTSDKETQSGGGSGDTA
jgi:hypothetical protein